MRWLTSEISWLKSRSGAELTLAFASGTFQTCVLVFALLVLIFLLGDLGKLLGGLSSAVGIGVFLLLWLPTLYCTVRALHELEISRLWSVPAGRMIVCGMKWGTITGGLIWAVLFGILVVATISGVLADGAVVVLPFMFIILVIIGWVGAVAAGAIGCLSGLALLTVETLLLLVATRLVANEPPEASAP